jgi:hypothetical protein
MKVRLLIEVTYVDRDGSHPQPIDGTDRGVSVVPYDPVLNEILASGAASDIALSANRSSPHGDADVLPASPFLMSASRRLAWGGLGLVVLWAAIFWAVRE